MLRRTHLVEVYLYPTTKVELSAMQIRTDRRRSWNEIRSIPGNDREHFPSTRREKPRLPWKVRFNYVDRDGPPVSVHGNYKLPREHCFQCEQGEQKGQPISICIRRYVDG